MENEKGKRIIRAAGLLVLTLGVCVGIYLLRPECLILKHTGFYCAGCGTQRMITSLLHGDIAAAFAYNPFMFFVLPAALIYCVAEGVIYINGKKPIYRRRWFLCVLPAGGALAIAFAVIRNIVK